MERSLVNLRQLYGDCVVRSEIRCVVHRREHLVSPVYGNLRGVTKNVVINTAKIRCQILLVLCTYLGE